MSPNLPRGHTSCRRRPVWFHLAVCWVACAPAIARTFSLNPQEILYVGDEIRDLQAARRARVEAAAVTWGFNSRESLAREAPTYLVEHPRALLNVI